MRYTPGMVIAAAGVVIWFTVTDGGPYLLPLLIACAASAFIDGVLGVRPFWLPREDVPNEKFYRKK